MPLQNIQLSFNNINFSVEIDDIVYYSTSGSSTGGFNQTATSNTLKLGKIVSKVGHGIIVEYDDVLNPQVAPPNSILTGAYISFAKDKSINTTSLVGYYASVKFVNGSRNKIELFSVGSEVSESSK